MQSKRSKTLFIIIPLALISLLVAAMLHEPRLVQTDIEQVLDAKSFAP